MLLLFPACRKYRMVRKVYNKHIEEMRRDIEREKANAFLCMHPAISRVSFTDLFFLLF